MEYLIYLVPISFLLCYLFTKNKILSATLAILLSFLLIPVSRSNVFTDVLNSILTQPTIMILLLILGLFYLISSLINFSGKIQKYESFLIKSFGESTTFIIFTILSDILKSNSLTIMKKNKRYFYGLKDIFSSLLFSKFLVAVLLIFTIFGNIQYIWIILLNFGAITLLVKKIIDKKYNIKYEYNIKTEYEIDNVQSGFKFFKFTAPLSIASLLVVTYFSNFTFGLLVGLFIFLCFEMIAAYRQINLGMITEKRLYSSLVKVILPTLKLILIFLTSIIYFYLMTINLQFYAPSYNYYLLWIPALLFITFIFSYVSKSYIYGFYILIPFVSYQLLNIGVVTDLSLLIIILLFAYVSLYSKNLNNQISGKKLFDKHTIKIFLETAYIIIVQLIFSFIAIFSQNLKITWTTFLIFTIISTIIYWVIIKKSTTK